MIPWTVMKAWWHVTHCLTSMPPARTQQTREWQLYLLPWNVVKAWRCRGQETGACEGQETGGHKINTRLNLCVGVGVGRSEAFLIYGHAHICAFTRIARHEDSLRQPWWKGTAGAGCGRCLVQSVLQKVVRLWMYQFIYIFINYFRSS
jgi:hypothetical protein